MKCQVCGISSESCMSLEVLPSTVCKRFICTDMEKLQSNYNNAHAPLPVTYAISTVNP